jgi:rhamnosyltransferase
VIKINPRVAVLLAAYNGKPWLQRQVDSILAQNSIDVTIFVSVDRSDDGTEYLIDQISLSKSKIIVLPHGKKFGAAGPNFFRLISDVNFFSFDYIAFSDQDDVWYPNKLSRAFKNMAFSSAEAYSSNVTAFWPDGRKVLINKSQPQVKWDYLFEAAGPGCTYFISKKLALEIQAFIIHNEKKMQKIAMHDWFLYAFARTKKYHWVIDHHPSLLYRQHSRNEVGANLGLRAFVTRAIKVLNGWAFAQSALIADLLGVSKYQPVKTWLSGSRLSYLKLAINFWDCRRRLRDKFLFLFACLMLALIGSRARK